MTPILPISLQEQALALLDQLCKDKSDMALKVTLARGQVALSAGDIHLLASPFGELMELRTPLIPATTSTTVADTQITEKPRPPAKPKSEPAPIQAPEVPCYDPDQWMRTRERLRQIPKLHDFCEIFLEAINLPAREWHSQTPQIKSCKIELAGKFVAEGKAETWFKARTRAALGVVARLDRPLCEEWLAMHNDFLLAHSLSGRNNQMYRNRLVGYKLPAASAAVNIK